MSRTQHGYPWQSLANLPYHSLPLGGLLHSNQHPRIVGQCRSLVGDPHCPCVGFHRRTLLISSSLLLQQCPACLVHLTRMVCEIGGRLPYSCFLVGCRFHDLFKTARSILVQLPSSLFSRRFVRVQVVQPYSSTDITTAWKNCRFSLSVRSDFHMTDNLFVTNHAFPIRVLISLSVDEILLPK